MLQLTGKCLGVESENVNGPSGAFTSTTIYVLDGYAATAVSVGRDFPPGELPREGEDVALEVVVSAFSRKAGGAGVRITALSRIKAGARIAAAAS